MHNQTTYRERIERFPAPQIREAWQMLDASEAHGEWPSATDLSFSSSRIAAINATVHLSLQQAETLTDTLEEHGALQD